MSTTPVNQLTVLAAAPLTTNSTSGTGRSSSSSSFFEAMARAWGETLDKQADAIQQKSDEISAGNDKPEAITELTAQSLKMGFLSNSSHSSISSVGEALSTMARKQ